MVKVGIDDEHVSYCYAFFNFRFSTPTQNPSAHKAVPPLQGRPAEWNREGGLSMNRHANNQILF